MKIYLNADCTIEKKITSRIFQGSHYVDSIDLYGEFESYQTQVTFRLPDGYTITDDMSAADGYRTYSLSKDITAKSGRLSFSFSLIDNQTGKIRKSPTIHTFIEESIDDGV